MELSEDFVAQVRANHRRLVRVVSVTADSSADAEDAVQEAFARAWERLARGQAIEDLAAWVVTVALNVLRSRARRPFRFGHPALSHGTLEARVDDDLIDLRAAVRALPKRQAQCVVLHYLLGYDVRSIANTLNVGESTVKTALARARTSLATTLTEATPDATRP